MEIFIFWRVVSRSFVFWSPPFAAPSPSLFPVSPLLLHLTRPQLPPLSLSYPFTLSSNVFHISFPLTSNKHFSFFFHSLAKVVHLIQIAAAVFVGFHLLSLIKVAVWKAVFLIMPLKKGIMFFTYITRFVCVCLCVCLSVITFVARWLDLATWCQVRSTLSTRTWKCNTSRDDPFPFPFHIDHPDKITFWPVTSKVMNGFTPNFTCT